MEPTTQILLAKLLKAQYVESFLNGNLFMNSASYFKKLEATDQVRSDGDEGIDWAIQAKELAIQGPDGEWIPIAGIIGPLKHYTEDSAKFHMLCMYMFTDNPAEVFDPRNLQFGDRFVFILNSAEFFRRVREAVRELGYTCQHRPIEYVDRHTYHGPMGPLRKFDEYAFQNEFRLVLRSGEDHKDEPLTVKIGDIRDICWSGQSGEIAKIVADMLSRQA
jgi:hypothetical protein